MGKLAQFGKVMIKIRGNDHLPPHFHVITPDYDTLVTIRPVAVHRGSLPSDVWAVVRDWAEDHQALLITEWNRWNPNHRTE